MENNIIVSGNSKEVIKDVLFQENCEISVENGRRVLGVTARSRVIGYEALEKELRVSVKTAFCVVTCDGDGNYYTENGECESIRTVAKDGVGPQVRVCLNALVTDCERLSTSNPVKVRATVEISGWYVKCEELTFLNVCDGTICCKTEQATVENVVPLSENTVALSYTDEARMPIAKLIDCSGCVTVDGVYPSSGTYRVDGDLILRVVAITDNGQFITQNFSHPFSVENADELVVGGMRIEAEGRVKSLSFTVTESDKRVLVCDATVKLCALALEEREVEKAIDVYSVSNEIEIKTETKRVNSHFCMRSVREKASAVLSVGGIGEVLAAFYPGVSVGGSVGSEGINVEGVLSVPVLYLDENNVPQSVCGEVPFISNLGGEFPCDTVFAPEVIVTSVGARPRGSGEIEITAELLVTVRGAQSKEIKIISDVTVGEPKEDDDFAVSLYIARPGETLWEVAKALNTDEQTLAEQNEDIALPLKGGEKILLYKNLPE